MAVVKLEEGTLSIDAAVIGRGLNVEPSLVQVRMREGKITVLGERGVDEDAGRYRLTFFYENRRFRLVVDEEGNAVQRSRQRPRTSASLRKVCTVNLSPPMTATMTRRGQFGTMAQKVAEYQTTPKGDQQCK